MPITNPDEPVVAGLIPEIVVPGKPLGRHIEFHEKSKQFPARLLAPPAPLETRRWRRPTAPFNQGSTGSCTGNGTVGVLATLPYRSHLRRYTERLARNVYSKATVLDNFEGTWPPDDTGSSVLAAMKSAASLGLCASYHWCFSSADAFQTLSHVGPLCVGFSWYEGFDQPDADGLVKVAGANRGGHCFEVLGIDVERQRVEAINSWGSEWGVSGRFFFSFDDFDRLMEEQGEAATVVV